MRRRLFLKWAAAGLTGLTTGIPISRSKNRVAAGRARISGNTLKKGFMLDTFPEKDRFSIREQFEMLKKAGFDGVEPPSGLNRSEVLEAKSEFDLDIPSVVVSTHWSSPLSSPDPAVRKAGIDGIENALYDAHNYGASIILVVPGVVNENVSYTEAYRRSQSEIKKVLPLAEELDITIGIENVWNHFLLSPMEAARYVDEFESPHVGWYFDIGNILNYGWPHHWIEALGDRIVMVHIKEFSRQKRNDEGLWNGFRVHYTEGDNDWPVIMQALKKAGYSGYAIAEPSYRGEDLAPQHFLDEFVSNKMDTIISYFG